MLPLADSRDGTVYLVVAFNAAKMRDVTADIARELRFRGTFILQQIIPAIGLVREKRSLRAQSAVAEPSRPLGQTGLALWNSVVVEYAVENAAAREIYCWRVRRLIGAERSKPSAMQRLTVAQSRAD
jgi:hypothetical protein